jgi:hypothetical protein
MVQDKPRILMAVMQERTPSLQDILIAKVQVEHLAISPHEKRVARIQLLRKQILAAPRGSELFREATRDLISLGYNEAGLRLIF